MAFGWLLYANQSYISKLKTLIFDRPVYAIFRQKILWNASKFTFHRIYYFSTIKITLHISFSPKLKSPEKGLKSVSRIYIISHLVWPKSSFKVSLFRAFLKKWSFFQKKFEILTHLHEVPNNHLGQQYCFVSSILWLLGDSFRPTEAISKLIHNKPIFYRYMIYLGQEKFMKVL